MDFRHIAPQWWPRLIHETGQAPPADAVAHALALLSSRVELAELRASSERAERRKDSAWLWVNVALLALAFHLILWRLDRMESGPTLP